MSAVENLRQSEQNLIAVIKAATASLDAVGTNELTAALAELEQARQAALARLAAAADVVRATFNVTAADAGSIATTLSADLFGAKVEPKVEPPQQVATEHPCSVEPAPVTAPYGAVEPSDLTREIVSISRGEGWTETTGSSPLPPAIAAAVAACRKPSGQNEEVQPAGVSPAAPSPNGNGSVKRRRRGSGS